MHFTILFFARPLNSAYKRVYIRRVKPNYNIILYSLAVVQHRFADFDGETRGFVETIPFGVYGRTGGGMEGDVRPFRGLQRSRFRRRPTRTRVCNTQEKDQN